MNNMVNEENDPSSFSVEYGYEYREKQNWSEFWTYLSVSGQISTSSSKIPVFTTLKYTSYSGEHFEVTAWMSAFDNSKPQHQLVINWTKSVEGI
jgi:hypothetical protein